MARYIAFLRAINVGGHIVKMERLSDLFKALGFANVETFIASGNVIFEARGKPDALEQKIERHLQKELGYAVKTFLRTDAELAAIAAHEPFADAPTSEAPLFVCFLPQEPEPGIKAKLLSIPTEVDDFHFHGRELYWRCQIKVNESKFSGPKLEKTLGMATTVRNANTVRRLVAKYPPRT